jgi:hypothetical protein
MEVTMIYTILSLALGSTAQAWQPTFPMDIHSYSCSAYYVEGEGVSVNGVDCRSHQRLGLLGTTFTHYLGANAQGSNFSLKQRDSNYDVCEASLPRVRCGEIERRPQFSISTFAEGPFQVPVSLAANGAGGLTRGFAVAVDQWGQCPFGMERVDLYQSSIPRNLRTPLPSNLPSGNRGSDWVVENPTFAHELARVLVRYESMSPCNENGSCHDATWSEVGQDLADLPFQTTGQAVCVLPR